MWIKMCVAIRPPRNHLQTRTSATFRCTIISLQKVTSKDCFYTGNISLTLINFIIISNIMDITRSYMSRYYST